MFRDLFQVIGFMTMHDPVEVNIKLSESFQHNLKAIESEFYSSLSLRLPTLHAFPPYVIDPKSRAIDIPNSFRHIDELSTTPIQRARPAGSGDEENGLAAAHKAA